MNAMPAPTPVRHWPIALAWGALGGVGAALVLPYVLALMPPAQPLTVPLWVVVLSAAVQNAVLITLLG